MYAPTYFPRSYFPVTYFPAGGVSVASTGSWFPPEYFAPTYWTRSYFPGGATVTPVVTYADLWESLVAYVDTSVTALAGAIYADRSPNTEEDGDAKTLPYAVYDQGVGGVIDYMTISPQITSGTASIAIYSTSKTEANSLARSLASTLKDAPLEFTDGTLMYFRARTIYQGTLDPDPGPGGVDIYQSVVLFDYQYNN